MKFRILTLLSAISLLIASCSENEKVNPKLTLEEEISELLNSHPGVVNFSKTDNSEINFQFIDSQSRKEVLMKVQELMIHHGHENGLIGLPIEMDEEHNSRLQACTETWTYHPAGSGKYVEYAYMSVCITCGVVVQDCMIYETL